MDFRAREVEWRMDGWIFLAWMLAGDSVLLLLNCDFEALNTASRQTSRVLSSAGNTSWRAARNRSMPCRQR